jgi:hypothetical protein
MGGNGRYICSTSKDFMESGFGRWQKSSKVYKRFKCIPKVEIAAQQE